MQNRRLHGIDTVLQFVRCGVTDIDDLEHAEVGMPADVVNVYENLKAGSYNHLDAFRSAIEAYNR